jgi:hypothetical protein
MKHPLIRTGRSLSGMVLVLLGLSAYGCGDSSTVTEPASLGNLSVSTGELQPKFNPSITSYTVELSTNVSSTTITASPRVAGDAIRIDNQPTSSKTVTLDSAGAEQSVNIVVTETGTGGTSKSYTVRVKRASLAGNNSLSNLTIAPGSLDLPFDQDSLSYKTNVENGIGSVTVTPTLSDPAATMTVNGQPAISGQPRSVDLNGGGQATAVTITVTAQNGSTKSYEITVSRGPSTNNNLRGLTISSGTLDPSFRASRTAYTVNVGGGVSSVRVRPTLADTTATITVNGETIASGQDSQSIGLGSPGAPPTIITIIVIAQNGSPKPYSVTVSRVASGNNSLSGLTIQPGSLDFKPDTTLYNVNVGNDVPSVAVSATKADSSAVISGDLPSSGRATIQLPTPGTTSILITVTAQNGTSKNYRINMIKAAPSGNNDLSRLTIEPGSLDFKPDTFTYDVNVGSGVESVLVRATKADPKASLSGDLGTSGRGTITLPAAGPTPTTTPISIRVTAQDGTFQTYLINVIKGAASSNNNLSALTVSVGSVEQTLNPSFSQSTREYTVDNVAPEVTEVIVRATKDDRNAVISGRLDNSGQATIPLEGGNPSTTIISFKVTAPDNTSKDYKITVNRAAPVPKPDKPAAPTMMREDDSCTRVFTTGLCFPPTSDTDNETREKRPRFIIPAPKEGETPHLFIDNQEDTRAEYSTTGRTLKPGRDLDNGPHMITTTLSNGGGASPQSDPLSIKINTSEPGNVES